MRTPPIIWLIILLNVVVFLLWQTGGEPRMVFMEDNFAVSWDALMAGHWWTLLTAVFSHYLFLHILLNMLVLNSFGPIVVQLLGTRFFVIFYLIAGVVSSLSHAMVSNFILHTPDLPAVGASGSIAGVLLLFCLLFPKEKILLLGIIPLPAIWGALAFVALDLWGLVAQAEGGGLPIGHGAHLGGAFCGLIAYLYLRARGVRPQMLRR
jgi:membrane associated rhomboid family serine protease